MLPDAQNIHDRPPGWRTAAIMDQSSAKQFIYRLTRSKIDHQTRSEGQSIRVMVPKDDLQAALDLRTDTPLYSSDAHPNHQTNYQTSVRLLITLPLGATIGTAISYFGKVEYRGLPAICSVV